MLDLDGFKAVNDEYGHEEGDRVLQRFAHFLIRHKRADDVLVRLGGDEFVLFVEVVSPANMNLIAERLVNNAPRQSPLTFSVGHAYRKPNETLEQVIARADAAMYAAKAETGHISERRQGNRTAGSIDNG
ncbi:MAG: GGDEF domain-containing protein, partial [Acidobacteriota bacterium]